MRLSMIRCACSTACSASTLCAVEVIDHVTVSPETLSE
jgi:hypothetical protein